ncbi:hypothetical protein ACFE04_010777 [Oxalis oulophora]
MEEEFEWTAKRVRDTFIDFFRQKDHVFHKSSPVVPHDDPSLLFTNAGMNQFKPIFLGTVHPKSELGRLTRACNTQKCIRAGGKHNDLDDVGKDTYHHTFFEMLGNWSFGNDYFKIEAIQWAWELLTKVYGLPTDRIYATYFGGDDKAGLAPDHEARDLWLQFLPADRVLPFGCKDNFWEMGDTGPCGPCTEIHYDRIGNRNAGHLVNNDDPTCIEIWNLVFIQFNRENDGTLKLLPSKHVDTGMGFERLTSILQNKSSNYDTDVFMPIFNAIQQVTGAQPYVGEVLENKTDIAYRVVADHIRTLSFAIADGSRPGNEGREYVLRHILRRAVRFGIEVLNGEQGFLNKLVKVLVELMGDDFPELRQHESEIRKIITEEEARFGKTLQKGIEKFRKSVKGLRGKILSGQDAFILWDTFGFPLDLTKIARGTIAMDAFATAELQKREFLATDDSFKFIWLQEHKSIVKAIYNGSQFVKSAAAGDEVGIVLESTSFYAEQGGQIFDIGVLEGPFATFNVCNVQIFGGYVLHIGSLSGATGKISEGHEVICKVDYDRRKLIAVNHTCTHMLNFALREVLGDHIDQKGSVVDPEKLRFDFSHGEIPDPEQLRRIESIVNEQIKDELDVYAKEVSLAEAKQINGLRAVFGEVYPDPVRVVSIGKKVEDLLNDPKNEEWSSYSAELCGGTHISNTREAKVFAILSEGGKGKGIRRLFAVTSEFASKAIELANSLEQEVNDSFSLAGSLTLKEVAALRDRVKSAPIPDVREKDIMNKIGQLEAQVKKVQKKIVEENKKKIVKVVTETAEAAASEGKSFCIACVDVGLDLAALREAVTKVTRQGMSVMVFSTARNSDKVVACAGLPQKSAESNRLVSEWLSNALEPIRGKCGAGKEGLATGQHRENNGCGNKICINKAKLAAGNVLKLEHFCPADMRILNAICVNNTGRLPKLVTEDGNRSKPLSLAYKNSKEDKFH